jgi:hypothetical protein
MVDIKQERALAKNRIRRRGIYLIPNLRGSIEPRSRCSRPWCSMASTDGSRG